MLLLSNFPFPLFRASPMLCFKLRKRSEKKVKEMRKSIKEKAITFLCFGFKKKTKESNFSCLVLKKRGKKTVPNLTKKMMKGKRK